MSRVKLTEVIHIRVTSAQRRRLQAIARLLDTREMDVARVALGLGAQQLGQGADNQAQAVRDDR